MRININGTYFRFTEEQLIQLNAILAEAVIMTEKRVGDKWIYVDDPKEAKLQLTAETIVAWTTK
jgi:hypothetical protein